MGSCLVILQSVVLGSLSVHLRCRILCRHLLMKVCILVSVFYTLRHVSDPQSKTIWGGETDNPAETFANADDYTDAKLEWIVMRGLLFHAAGNSQEAFYAQVIFPAHESFPILGKIATVGVTVPVTCVNCRCDSPCDVCQL